MAHKFPSSTTFGVEYTVDVDPQNGFLSCDCPAFFYRRKCNHVIQVRDLVAPPAVPSHFLEAALGYAEVGFHVIPVEPRGKRPLVAWKDFQDVRPTEAQIRSWWAWWPNANIAIVLGQGRMAVDLDGGPEAEKLLNDAGIILPADAPRSKTNSGFHVIVEGQVEDRIGLFKGEPLPDAAPTPSGKPRVAQVDIRGRGVIIAPPSVHPSGHVYEWLTPLSVDPPPCPVLLLERINYVPRKLPLHHCKYEPEHGVVCGAKVGWHNENKVRVYDVHCAEHKS